MIDTPQESISVQHGAHISSVLSVYYQSPAAYTPLLVCLPAMGISSKHYGHLAHFLATQLNAIVAIADWRGLGTSSVRVKRGLNFGYKEMLEDLEQLMGVIYKKYPHNPIYLLGHSLGGQLSCLYSAWGSVPIKGMVWVASCSIYYKGWPGFAGYKILAFTQLARLLSRVLGYYPGKRIGFGGTQTKGVIYDWSQTAKTGRYEPLHIDFDFESSMKQVTLPILAVEIAHDAFAPQTAIDNLAAKFAASASITRVLIDGKAQQTPKLTHINWVKHPEALLPALSQWLTQHKN